MKSLNGKLEKQFFGGEVWVLHAEGGAQYQLKGAIPDGLEGQQVRVEARPAAQGFGFSMVGEVLNVKKIEKA
jgi:hypothetical protein